MFEVKPLRTKKLHFLPSLWSFSLFFEAKNVKINAIFSSTIVQNSGQFAPKITGNSANFNP
jgi:hypothetical protein